MWLELVPIQHQCLAELAAVRQFPLRISTVLPCFRFVRLASHVLPWIIGTTSLVVALAPRLGGFGVPNFFPGLFAAAVRGAYGSCSIWGVGRKQLAGSVLTHGVQALPVHGTSLPKAGAAC